VAALARIRIPNPAARRWMLFVDGENLTLRAQKLAADKELPLREGTHFMRDCFVWLPGVMASQALFQEATPIQDQAVRAYYYTSLVADEAKRTSVREAIWNLGFTPQVFKKDRGQSKSKGVDITLTKDVLSHAFMSNYDVAVLVAGDANGWERSWMLCSSKGKDSAFIPS
jgi:hypothetical protein